MTLILVINQHNAQILFYNKFIICLYTYTGRPPTECDDTRCCI